MLSCPTPGRRVCVLCVLLSVCVAFLTACAGILGAGPASGTPTTPPIFATLTANASGSHGGLGVPPSVAAFCPSPQTLAPIIGETVSPDFTTGTHGASTTCGYLAPSGDTCEFTITAWSDAPSAKRDYTKLMDDVKQVGGQTQTLTGLGDAAFYWVDEDVTVLKGSDDFFDKCYFLPPRPHAVDEHVDVQIAQLLLTHL